LIAWLLAEILRTLLKRFEESDMTKPIPPPKGKYIHVDALKHLVNTWRQKAAREDWGLAYALEECADQLEYLYDPHDKDEPHDESTDEGRTGQDRIESSSDRKDPTEVDPQPGGSDR
jgi:hypothetical protein